MYAEYTRPQLTFLALHPCSRLKYPKIVCRVSELELILEDGEEEGISQPEFWPVNKSPFYNVPTGARSGYNHVLEVGLLVLSITGGELDLDAYRRVITEKFGDGTAWQDSYKKRKQGYNPAKRTAWTEPVPGPWIHEAVLHFLQEGEGDVNNQDMDGFLLSLPHLVFNAEKENVLEECQKIVELLTRNPKTVSIALVQCRILQNVILTGSMDLDKLEPGEGLEFLRDMLEKQNTPHITLVREFGNNCYVPGSMVGAIHAVLSSSSYSQAIRLCIRAGGCNCSRSNYSGAIVAAVNGIQDI
ncbi:crystallin J1A isoform X2 [Eurytemora carolleeae]|nr:crystallin J1A isoform X2 [Eurytemora carolleeae]XP_023328634.1 crystallin J1A isoform X2 [Eurytemora carolleeae]|eukprot:XP_023328633.1 crystallin J1A-like isoform X2 [Eurytemora affinis]